MNGVNSPQMPYINRQRARRAPMQGGRTPQERSDRMRIVKLVLGLGVLGAVALTGYAYLGDLSPDQQRVTAPLALAPVEGE